MVDRRDKAGGHWNDAYPFVRLHQPSSYYGVDSTPLGRARLDTDGLNAGFEELASGVEVASYFHAVMQDRLLASGRVSFVPMTEHLGDGTLRNVLNGTHTQVEAGRIVDASMCENGIPLTHKRQFTVGRRGGVYRAQFSATTRCKTSTFHHSWRGKNSNGYGCLVVVTRR